jgi:hypothetical protein
VKQTRERLQSGAGRPPPEPIGPWHLYTVSLCQVHSRGDTYFGGILIFLVIFEMLQFGTYVPEIKETLKP